MADPNYMNTLLSKSISRSNEAYLNVNDPKHSPAQEKAMRNMVVSWGFSGVNDFDNPVTLNP